jgi:hypothetical protein
VAGFVSDREAGPCRVGHKAVASRRVWTPPRPGARPVALGRGRLGLLPPLRSLCPECSAGRTPGAFGLPYYAYVRVATSTAASSSRLRLNTASGSRPPPRPAPHYGPADSHLLRQLNATSRRHLAPEQSVTIINWRCPYSGVSSSS